MSCGALVANWNGMGVIDRCLGSIAAASARLAEPAPASAASVKPAPEPMELVVVDDASSDASPQLIRDSFPSFRLLPTPRNLGFGAAVNFAMERMTCEWVFLLNNDLALEPDFFERILLTRDALADPALFAVGGRTIQWESGELNHGGMNARWDAGLVRQAPFDAERERGGAAPSVFFQGGSALVHRARFLELGGFCPIFHPGYWEDYDVAWRAARRGWNTYYEPRAVARHWGKRSMSNLLGPARLALTIKRNHLLFNWINLRDRGLLARALAGAGALALRPERDECLRAAGWPRAFAEALKLLPQVLEIRRERAGEPVVRSDREILEMGQTVRPV